MAVYPYCSIADIEGHTGVSYTPGSQPSRQEVLNIIRRVSNDLNAVLQAAGYTLPINRANTEAIEFLRGLASLGGAYRAWYAGNRGTATFPAAESWREDYNQAKEDLRNLDSEVPGLTSDNGGSSDDIGVIRSIVLS